MGTGYSCNPTVRACVRAQSLFRRFIVYCLGRPPSSPCSFVLPWTLRRSTRHATGRSPGKGEEHIDVTYGVSRVRQQNSTSRICDTEPVMRTLSEEEEKDRGPSFFHGRTDCSSILPTPTPSQFLHLFQTAVSLRPISSPVDLTTSCARRTIYILYCLKLTGHASSALPPGRKKLSAATRICSCIIAAARGGKHTGIYSRLNKLTGFLAPAWCCNLGR